MIQQTRELRGIPLWLLKAYLMEIGGAELEPGVVQGRGWKIDILCASHPTWRSAGEQL